MSATLIDASTFGKTCEYLHPADLLHMERVCTPWKKMIGSENQTIWKEQCERQKTLTNVVPLASTVMICLREHRSENVDKTFTTDLCEIIASYAPNYRAQALAIHGKIWLDVNRVGRDLFSRCRDIFLTAKNKVYALWLQHREKEHVYECCYNWGTSQTEPYTFTQMQFDGVSSVNFIPLRLLFDRIGNSKQEGDFVSFVWKNRKVRLMIVHIADARHPQARTFQEGLHARINVATRSFDASWIETSQDLAKTQPNWPRPE